MLLLNNLTPNKIWGGDTFITHMNMSNTCYLGLKKGKTALIVGILLIVVAVVITVVSFGAATPLGAALGAAGSAIAIGVTIAAGVLGITTQVLEVMHQNRETGLDAFENDNILDNSIGGNGSTALKYGCEHLRGILVESEFNTELSLLYQFVAKEDYNLNFGIGVSTFPFHSTNIDFMESFYLPLQIEIIPFKDIKNLGLVLESAYHFSDATDASGIRNSIGIRYIFN